MNRTDAAAAGFVVALFAAGVFLLVSRLMNQAADTAGDVEVALASGAAVVDVRTPGEFAAGHVAGAVNIPVDALPARLAEIPADRLVIVYCASGNRSARAAGLLRKAGRTVVDAKTAGAFPRPRA